MQGKILLPLDGSEAAYKAFVPAKSIAEILDMTLCILHVSQEECSRLELLEKLNLKQSEMGCFVVKHSSGDPKEEILKEGESSNYIVMGTHGVTCDETLRMGSTTAMVIEGTTKPVLLIKPNACLNITDGKWVPHKALIPLNGAPGSAQALAPAIKILERTTAQIDLLHIYREKTEPVKEEGGFTAPYYEDYPQHEWPSWSKEFLKRFCPTGKNHIKMNVSLARGDAADEITAFAEKNRNDFIAIAWHGTMSEFRALTLKKLLFKSDCPIMLIKIKD